MSGLTVLSVFSWQCLVCCAGAGRQHWLDSSHSHCKGGATDCQVHTRLITYTNTHTQTYCSVIT